MVKIQVNSQGKAYFTSAGKVLLGNTFGTKTITENGTYTASSDNLDGYSSVTVNVSGGGESKYSLFDRIKDDSNNEIGTVCGFFTDSNDVEYAVVCLDAIYRSTSGQWAAAMGAVTNMPLYNTWNSNTNGSETATENCNLILANTTSTAISHCRNLSFIIDGTTYYGQLPNICELLMIVGSHTILYNKDTTTTSSAASGLNFVQFGFPSTAWSSSQYNSPTGWSINQYGYMINNVKTENYFVCPVLEIPNT